MKTNKPKRAGGRRLFSRRATTAQDPWLIFHIQHFNLAGGWSQLLMRQQARQFSR
jgi:hypothetical protein